MTPTPYLELNEVLDELVSRMRAVLKTELVGAYLQGSFAVGDFDEHSDVDMVFVVLHEMASDQVDALQVMHDQIYQLDSRWAQHLEGSYFPTEILRTHAGRGQDLWYLDNGARFLIRSDHCNTILVRRVLWDKGIPLAGPSPRSLVEPISDKLLRAEIFETIDHWGRVILDDPGAYNNRFYQSFIVLNFCRMLHDLHHGRPGSKREGAEWAKSILDPCWSALIDAAWDGRPNPEIQVRQPADPLLFADTLRLVKVVIRASYEYAAGIQAR